MAQQKPSPRKRTGKMHPIFIDLYLPGDPDEEERPRRRRTASTRKIARGALRIRRS
jgi:hypothetical protein